MALLNHLYRNQSRALKERLIWGKNIFLGRKHIEWYCKFTMVHSNSSDSFAEAKIKQTPRDDYKNEISG